MSQQGIGAYNAALKAYLHAHPNTDAATLDILYIRK